LWSFATATIGWGLSTSGWALLATKEIIELVIKVAPQIIEIGWSTSGATIILRLLIWLIGGSVLTTLGVFIPFGCIRLRIITPAWIID